MTAIGIAVWALTGFLAAAGLQLIIRCGWLTAAGAGTRGSVTVLGGATAALFAALAWRIGVKPDLIAYSWLAATAVPLAKLDWSTQRLPTKLLWPTGLILAVLLTLAAVINGNVYPLVRAVTGMIILLAFYGCIYFVCPGHLGGGDVRLGGVLGLALGWTGWTTIVTGTLLTWTVAAAAILALHAFGRLPADRRIPLGPFLIIGALAAVFTGTTQAGS